jgi:hypothetical protein
MSCACAMPADNSSTARTAKFLIATNSLSHRLCDGAKFTSKAAPE